jgi:hypothetical protein
MAFDSSLINKGWDFKEPKGIFKRYFVEVDLAFEFNRWSGPTSIYLPSPCTLAWPFENPPL